MGISGVGIIREICILRVSLNADLPRSAWSLFRTDFAITVPAGAGV